MHRTLILAAALTVAAYAVPASAIVYNANFSGPVTSTQGAAGRAVGDIVSGSFALTDAGQFTSFTIDGKNPSAGYGSTAAYSPAVTNPPDAIYRAEVLPVQQGGTSNSSFTLDLSSLTAWPGASESAIALLGDAGQLTTNLDLASNLMSTFPSTFGYYTASADGLNIVALTGDLASVSVSTAGQAVLEPASLALLGGSLLGLGATCRLRGG